MPFSLNHSSERHRNTNDRVSSSPSSVHVNAVSLDLFGDPFSLLNKMNTVLNLVAQNPHYTVSSLYFVFLIHVHPG